MKNTTKSLATIALLITVYSCQSYTHVVVSDGSLMEAKSGKIEKAKLDSTFHMYDKVKIVDGEVVKVETN